MKIQHCAALILLLASSLDSKMAAQASSQQLSTSAEWATNIAEQYLIYPDITYGVANNYTLKLDVWQRKGVNAPVPTLVYYHGGGWIFGDRTGATLLFMPYVEMGWNVVNVEYRMASVSHAPAAVEDARCALRWVFRNAKQYNFDTNKIVLTGHSAGGHLALISGILPNGTGLDNDCYGTEPLQIAAIINWFGPSDVADLLQGANLKNYAVMWMGSQTDAPAIARRVSPIAYIRRGIPAILSVHGEADPVVPYAQSAKLHAALTAAGVPNELVTIRGGAHGGFTAAENADTYAKIKAFLKSHGVP